MPGVLLDRTANVWRMTNNAGAVAGQTQTAVYPGIRCAIVPISSFDSEQPYARESTHVVWVAHWVQLRKEDEVRYGRRLPDDFNNVMAEVYVVNGRRRFTQSVSELAYYVREKS